MGAVLLSILLWINLIVTWIVLFPVDLVIFFATVLFDRKRVILHRFSCFWGSIYYWTNPLWRVRFKGRENIKSGQTYILVSNHQSLADIIVLYGLFKHFKWVAKAELFKVPILGWNMMLNNYIRIDRVSKKSHIKMMRNAEKTILSGSSLMIFPEGTRTRDGEIKPFKDGAFSIAHKTKTPIIPIVIDGTFDALPRTGLIMRNRQKINVHVLEPVEFDRFKELNTKETANYIKDIMSDHLKTMRL